MGSTNPDRAGKMLSESGTQDPVASFALPPISGGGNGDWRRTNLQTNASALQMANEIFGDGVTVVSATYTGAANSSAIYSRGDARSPDATPGDTGVILSTGNAASFTQSSGDPNRSASTSTDTSGPNNNALFNALAGTNTYDAAMARCRFHSRPATR